MHCFIWPYGPHCFTVYLSLFDVFLDLSQRVVPTGWNYSHQGETRLRMRRRVGALSAWVAEHGGVPPGDPKRKGSFLFQGRGIIFICQEMSRVKTYWSKFFNLPQFTRECKGCWFGKHYFRKMEGPRFGHTHPKLRAGSKSGHHLANHQTL